jgi:hypothetical protein
MIHASVDNGIRYMPNARNGAYPQMDDSIAPPAPSKNLTIALASAGPEQQTMVMISATVMHFLIMACQLPTMVLRYRHLGVRVKRD